MPPIQRGRLRGFYAPEYAGNSIVNLMASIIRARGGRSPHRGLSDFPLAPLRNARRLAYVVLDGLGEHLLRRYLASVADSPFFGRQPRRVITTVFPATTAAAVTTFATGASPHEHGILGWHLHLGDLGLVATILLARTRTNVPMVGPDFPLQEYLRLPCPLASVSERRVLISYGVIPESRYSRAGLRWHEVHCCETLAGFSRHLLSFFRGKSRALAYAYWPGLDSLAHEYGVFARPTLGHLRELDYALADLEQRVREANAILLITADHGLMDSLPEKRIELREIPGFYDCLATVPSGDARAVMCFVRPSRWADFHRLARKHLRAASAMVPGDLLIRGGFFGRGTEHPALRNRVGDVVLLARPGYAFAATPAGFPTKFLAANHGGMSPEEMRVPLFWVY